jgi:hypothetical protein
MIKFFCSLAGYSVILATVACSPKTTAPVGSKPSTGTTAGTTPAAVVPADSITHLIRNAVSYPGYFPYWWDEKNGKIWLEINQTDKEFLYVNSLPAGVGSNDIGLDRGQLGNTRVVKFIRSGNKILLIQPNLDYRASSTNALERRSVEEAFAQSVLWGTTIAATHKGRILVDFTPFLMQDAHDVSAALARTNQGNYSLDAVRSAIYLERTKNFPKNSEWESVLTFTGKPAGEYIRNVTPTPSAVTVRQHHSFVELPDGDYKPRLFDPRSGYFERSWYNYSSPISAPINQRYIVRHRLKKKDPTAAVSEPVEPIVYYLDPGVPEPVRSALLDGARWWDQAFEAAGYRNAFIVKMLPADADPMDVRYNLIQWVHRATRGWSYGSAVTDPRTGEIIKGQVSLGSLRVRQDYLIAQGLRSSFNGDEQVDPVAVEMALARLRQLSAHEVGHTLGLAHNFASSVNDRASVMDYPHPYVTLTAQGNLDFSKAYDDKIGLFDKRAILYGYQDFPPAANEAVELEKILQENTRMGLEHISDEGARGAVTSHPHAHLWDNGPDAADELRRIMGVRAAALLRFGEKSIPKDRVMADLERVLVPLYLAHRYQTEAVSKTIGGIFYTYAVRGDGKPTNTPAAEAQQIKAFEALLQTLQPEFLALPEEIVRLIPPQPIGFDRDRELFKTQTGNFDPLAAAASSIGHTFDVLLMPERLNRLSEQQARGALSTFTLPYLLQNVRKTAWGEATTAMQREMRRLTQQVYVHKLLSLAASDGATATVKGHILMEMDALATEGEKQLPLAKNADDKAQWTYLLNQLKRFKEKPDQFKSAPAPPMPPGQPIGCREEEY